MNVTHKITMDLTRPTNGNRINVVEGDKNSRIVNVHLYENFVSWRVPTNASVLIKWERESGIGGEYSKLADGSSAWSAVGNILTITLSEESTEYSGNVKFSIVLTSGDSQISTFVIIANVHAVANGKEETNSGTASSDISKLQKQIGNLSDLETKNKSNLVMAINEVAANGGGSGGSTGTPGKDGGYYTPKVSQPTAVTMLVEHTPSKAGMPAVEPVTITLPVGSGSSQNGDGLTETASNLLITILRDGVYSSDQSANITALATELGVVESGGGDTPDEPDEPEVPEVTLSSISATYSGGDVAVGTVLTDLTGIVVTAHYSDGNTVPVANYTLSGEIAEGENTITVTYQGKTATFTVTGIAESTGENNGWTDGEAYAIEWTDGYKIDNASANETYGEAIETSGMSISNYLPCYGASAIMLGAGVYINYGVYFYDENKELIQRVNSDLNYPSPVSLNAYYCRVQCDTRNKATATVTPVKFAVLDGTTAWEAGKYYNLSYVDLNHDLNTNTGATKANNGWNVSDYTFCYGATTLKFMTYIATYRSAVCFYDESKNFISGKTISPSSWEVPEGAKYFRHGCSNTDTYKNGGCVNNPWLILE